jgi:hypothetical protein
MALPVTEPHLEPLAGPTVWTRKDLPDPEAWTYRIQRDTLAELAGAVAEVKREGTDMRALRREQFPLPSFAEDAGRILRQLRTGIGFVVMKGLPWESTPEDELAMMYWGLGAQLGTSTFQNIEGDLLYSVRDYGLDPRKGGVRGSKTAAELGFHTDSSSHFRNVTPDIVGLLTLKQAKSGGGSAILNAKALYNRILAQYPRDLERLYRPYHIDRRAEAKPGEDLTVYAPVFTYDGDLRMRFSLFILTGHDVAKEPLWARDIWPIILIHSLMQDPELCVEFTLENGDVLFMNNHFLAHARRAYEDHPEPEQKRHLMRMWLKFDDERARTGATAASAGVDAVGSKR